MSSQNKIDANRRNAQSSTGPRSPEGKIAVSTNAITHGLRATKHLLYFERYADFDRICRELTDEWHPATATESNLVEQMAVAQAKLVRLESILSVTFYQSFAMKCAACEDEITDKNGVVHPPEFIVDREFDVQKMITGVSQHIARVERSWHKALDTLMKLQDRRRKDTARNATPAEKPAQKAPIPPPPTKNDDQSQKGGGPIPRKEVGSCTNEGNDAIRSLPPDTKTGS